MFEELSKLFPKSSPEILQDICDSLSPQALPDTNIQSENPSPYIFEANAESLEQNCQSTSEVIFNLPNFENALQEKDSGLLEQSKKIKKESVKPVKIIDNKKENLETSAIQIIPKKKDNWKLEEDAQLISLYQEFGPKWSKIASLIHNRTGKQVRDRYLNTLRPDINQGDWTPEEQEKLEALYEKFGKKWCKIAAYLPGRTENQVKNKFYWEKKKKTSRKIKKMSKAVSQISGITLPTQISTEIQIKEKDINNGSLEIEPIEKGALKKRVSQNSTMSLNLDEILDDAFLEFTWDQEVI